MVILYLQLEQNTVPLADRLKAIDVDPEHLGVTVILGTT